VLTFGLRLRLGLALGLRLGLGLVGIADLRNSGPESLLGFFNGQTGFWPTIVLLLRDVCQLSVVCCACIVANSRAHLKTYYTINWPIIRKLCMHAKFQRSSARRFL